MLFTHGGLWRSADAASFHVLTDISKSPDAAPYAESAKALCQEWYPKINAVLYGKDHPLPFAELQILFAGTVVAANGSEQKEVPAASNGNKIWVSSNHCNSYYPQSNPVRWPRGFQAMMIHELTHVNQAYGEYPISASWVNEGIADYVRHKYFEKDLEPKLRLDTAGNLTGYSAEDNQLFNLEMTRAKLDQKGYLQSYLVAAAFFLWLEERKDKDIIRKLNLAMHEGRYSDGLFRQYFGSSLDALWQEFFLQRRP